LNVGTITIRTGDVTADGWHALLLTLLPPKVTLSCVALIVPDADRVSSIGQSKMADALFATPPSVPWLITVSDRRNLDTRIKLALLVYPGLGPNGRMRFLSQSGQDLITDAGNLQQPQ
jgi:hypothetical protein